MTTLAGHITLRAAAVLFVAALAVPASVPAHPHVFVDGGVDFVLDDQGDLTTLSVKWKYDPFEALMSLTALAQSLQSMAPCPTTARPR